jgi:hypothetical protein
VRNWVNELFCLPSLWYMHIQNMWSMKSNLLKWAQAQQSRSINPLFFGLTLSFLELSLGPQVAQVNPWVIPSFRMSQVVWPPMSVVDHKWMPIISNESCRSHRQYNIWDVKHTCFHHNKQTPVTTLYNIDTSYSPSFLRSCVLLKKILTNNHLLKLFSFPR